MNLILDRFCEVYQYLKPFRRQEFWSLDQHAIVPGAVYIIGRHEFHKNRDRWRQLIESGTIRAVFSNPHEGSETIRGQIISLGLVDLVTAGRLPIITGGSLPPEWPHFVYDSFLVKVGDYKENHQAALRTHEIFEKNNKPYKFLFLNGRMRSHRKWLIERLKLDDILQQSLWTNLDQRDGTNRRIKLVHDGQDLMQSVTPLQYLPANYEIAAYRTKIGQHDTSQDTFVKHQLFNNQWGEIYLNADAYIDTYFSLVTETVFEYPYSFRTEKIAKPLMIGHPWIAVSSCGYYRDLRSLGFATFESLIDESFDMIQDNQVRIEKIYKVVTHVLEYVDDFLQQARPICLHNQQHLTVLADQIQKQMPEQLLGWIVKHHGEI